MPSKRTIESFFTASSKRSCQHIENETAADEREVVASSSCVDEDDKPVTSTDKNGISNFIFNPPPPPLFILLRCGCIILMPFFLPPVRNKSKIDEVLYARIQFFMKNCMRVCKNRLFGVNPMLLL